MKLKLTNRSNSDMRLERLTVLSGRRPGSGQFGKVIPNGLHSWSNPALFQLVPGETYEQSYWTVAVQDPPLAAGFTTGQHNIDRFTVSPKRQELLIAAWGECDGCLLLPGQSRESDELFISAEDSPLAELERYADLAAAANDARVWPDNFATWCSWYSGWIRGGMYAHQNGLEAGVEDNIPLVAELFGSRGANRMRIVDDTDEMPYGDWDDRTKALPQGFSHLVELMQAAGVVPGIWLPVYMVSDKTRLYQEHPEWLGMNGQGQVHLQEFYGNTCGTLDTSHPEVIKHFEELAQSLRERGFRYVMTDFLVSSISAPQYHDPTLTKAEMHHRGLEALRRGFGRDVYWLGCGAILGPSMGLVDGMRISGDSFGDQLYAYLQAGTRWFYHRKLWLNDPDAIVCRGKGVEWNRGWMSWMALAGHVLTYGDSLDDLPAEQLTSYKRIFPPLNIAGRPLDLWENDPYLLWGVKLGEGAAAQKLFGLFHFAEAEGEEVKLNLDEISARIDSYDHPQTAPGRYLLWDFWGEDLLVVDGPELTLPLPDHTGRIFALHEDQGRPQLLGTTGHFSQGYLEVERMTWRESRGTLSGKVRGNGGDPTTLYFHVPEGFSLLEARLAGQVTTLSAKEPRVLALAVPAVRSPVGFQLQFAGKTAKTTQRPFVSGSPALWERSLARQKQLQSRAPEAAMLICYLDCPRDIEDGADHTFLRQLTGSPWVFQGTEGIAPAHFASIVFDAERIEFEATGLAPHRSYHLGLSWWDHNNDGRVQSVHVVGGDHREHLLIDKARLPAYADRGELPQERVLPLPRAATDTGRIRIIISNQGRRPNVPNAVVSEVWLYASP